MIIGKSIHPVEVKKIEVKIWTLRSEIEEALLLRKEDAHNLGIEPNFDDIHFFYSLKNSPVNSESSPATKKSEDLEGNEEGGENEEIDADILEMSAALKEESADSPNEDETNEENSTEAKEEVQKDLADNNDQPGDLNPENIENSEINNVEPIISEEKIQQKEELKYVENLPVIELPKSSDEVLEFYLMFPKIRPKEEALSNGFSMLADVDINAIRTFSQKSFLTGQTVIVEFQIPIKFRLLGEIRQSHILTNSSKIISNTKPNFRLYIKFLFKLPGERTNLRKFLKSIEPTLPTPPKKKKQSVENELDDLDF